MPHEKLTQKKKLLDRYLPLKPELIQNLEAWFRVELTYTSNAIEGNTLTRRETAVVIEKGMTIGNKSLEEHLEATNHARALDWVRSLTQKRPFEPSINDVLSIHRIILKSIDDLHAGRYRNPRKVPDLMNEFQDWLTQNSCCLDPVELAAEAHYRLVTIHPFVDGNGRTARLLMNYLLMAHDYPPAIIRKRDRLAYIGALEKAQLGGSKDSYERIIAEAVDRSLDIYLKAAQGESSMDDLDEEELMKIGQLANAAGESVSTIRYWTQEGLLEVAETTKSGYQLYRPVMILRCQEIKKLKKQRCSLTEIKKRRL